MKSAESLVENVTQLISFPEIAMQINNLLEDESSTARSVSSIIEMDPALTASLLKLANSSLYGGNGNIDSVTKAFMRVGSQEIRELTFGICASQAFTGISNELLSVADFWRHSLTCAFAARMLARKLKRRNAGMVFTAGLLHDVGHLVMFSQLPDQSSKALALCRTQMDGENLYLAERETFGFDHMDVGRELGKLWHWPQALNDCIAHHHDPFSHDCSDEELVVHIANSMATLAELESDDFNDAAPVDERAWAQLGLEPDDVLEVIGELNENAESMLELMVG